MDPLDIELTELITKLTKLQEKNGGAKKNSTVTEDGRFDRFMELRNQMEQRVLDLRESLSTVQNLEKSPGSNPKELIAAQSKVRTELSALNEDWKDLDIIYRHEARKKRSKFSPEVLKLRQQMLVQLQMDIQTMRDIQRSGYVKGYQAVRVATMEESEVFHPKEDENTKSKSKKRSKGPVGVVSKATEEMTDEHRFQLQRIRERDAEMDQEIEEIGKGVDQLRELAVAAHEEIKLQNVMLDTLGQKVDDVHEHVFNINADLKTTLEEARASDKICMDIFCLVILVGIIIVFVKVAKG